VEAALVQGVDDEDDDEGHPAAVFSLTYYRSQFTSSGMSATNADNVDLSGIHELNSTNSMATSQKPPHIHISTKLSYVFNVATV
jgi:hypothetical protein